MRRGVGKADTEYAPQLVTWLNQERWKDAEIEAAGKLSQDDMKAAQDRIDETKRRNEERDRMMVEEHRRKLGMMTA